jgi:hypothetical protein
MRETRETCLLPGDEVERHNDDSEDSDDLWLVSRIGASPTGIHWQIPRDHLRVECYERVLHNGDLYLIERSKLIAALKNITTPGKGFAGLDTIGTLIDQGIIDLSVLPVEMSIDERDRYYLNRLIKEADEDAVLLDER